jgi:hypothetical protein
VIVIKVHLKYCKKINMWLAATAASGGKKKGPRSSVKAVIDIVHETVTEVTSKLATTSTTDVRLNQEQSVSNIKCIACKLNITQTGKIQTKSIQNIDAKTTTDLINTVTDKLDNKLKNDQKVKNGFLSSLGMPSDGPQSLNASMNNIRDILHSKLTSDIINNIITKVNLNQTQKSDNLEIDPCGIGGNLSNSLKKDLIEQCPESIRTVNISQDISIQVVSEQVTNTIMDLIQQTASSSSVSNNLTQVQDVKNSGVDDVFKSIFSGFGSLLKPILSLMCCVCIALLAWSLSPAGQNASKSIVTVAGNVAKARAGV